MIRPAPRSRCAWRRPAASGAVAALVVLALSGGSPALAQRVAEPPPPAAVEELADALQELARDPNSLAALLDAAEASIALAELQPALGYLTRAEAIAPSDGRVRAGFAALMLRHNQPVEGLRMFAEAERLGAPMADYSAELGLAHDLVGDSDGAALFYTRAMAQGADDALRQRVALSRAIAGDRAGSEALLLPMLQRSDPAAYRARAFALAVLGDADAAVTIAETMLPPRLSSRLAPYLRYMQRLTRAQQAAAVHLGTFPRSDEIGRDDPVIAAFAASAGDRPAIAVARTGADARLEPAGPPMGASPPPPRVENLPPPEGRLETRPGLSQAFADLSLAPPPTASPAATGGVDITGFEPPRERPRPPAPLPAALHPSRHWVQLATGRDPTALGFDWRRIRRQAAGLLDDTTPHLTPWGESTRLLAGPFSANEAQALVTALKGKSLDSFRFTSDAGQEVGPIP